MGNSQPVNMRNKTINTENSHISAYNLRCETNEGEISSQPKFSDSHRLPATHAKKPGVKINVGNLEKAIIQNETRKAIFPSPNVHRLANTQSDLLSSFVVYTVRDQTQLSERENNTLKIGQNNGVIFRSANLPTNGLPPIASLTSQTTSSLNPQTSVTFNPLTKTTLGSLAVSNSLFEKKAPVPEPLTTSQISNEERLNSPASEKASKKKGTRNLIFETSSNQKALSIPNFNITIINKLVKEDDNREETKSAHSDRIPTSSDHRFETLSTEPQVEVVHETKMKKIHFRSKSPSVGNNSSRNNSGSPVRHVDTDREKTPTTKITVPPLSHLPQAATNVHTGIQNLPPLGPSAGTYSKVLVSERSRYQSGSDSARQNYHLQQFLQSKGVVGPSLDDSRSFSMDKMTSMKELIDKTGGKMPFFNPFQNENHSKTIGKEYTEEINKIAQEMAQHPDLKLSNASFDSVKSRSLSADHQAQEPNWKIIDDFFAARGWVTSGIRPHIAQNDSLASNGCFTPKSVVQTPVQTPPPAQKRVDDKPLIDMEKLKAETNYFTLCQKSLNNSLQAPSQAQVQAVVPTAQVQNQSQSQNASRVDDIAEIKKYTTNEKVENILKKINDINVKQNQTSFFLSSSAQNNAESVSYDYTPPVAASSNNQIILSLGSPSSHSEKNSSQNRLMELTKTVDDPSYTESFVFAKVSESSHHSDSVDQRERQESFDPRQAKNSKGKAELVLNDISKRIEEFTKILNTSHQQENADLQKSNQDIRLDGSISMVSSTQHVSIGSPNQQKAENPEPIESQSPIKGIKNESKTFQKTTHFNVSLSGLRGSDNGIPEGSVSSHKNDEFRKTTTDSAQIIKDEYQDKVFEKPITEEKLVYSKQHNYQPSAEASPVRNVNVPSLNVSEIHKHKFFDEKEWSQPVSPSTDWNHLIQNDSSQINDRIDKIAEEIKKADQLLEEKKKAKAASQSTPPKKEKQQPSPIQKKSPIKNIPVKKYSLQVGTHSRKSSLGEITSNPASTKKGPKEVKISISSLNPTKQKEIAELDSFQDEVASPRDQSPSNFVFPNESISHDGEGRKKNRTQKFERESQQEFEFITEDLDLNNRVSQNIFDPRTFSQNSLTTGRSSQLDHEPHSSSRSRPLSPFSTLDDRVTGLSARTSDSRKGLKSSRSGHKNVFETSPLKKNSYSIKNIPPHRMLQKTPPKSIEKNTVPKDRSGSISERNFTLGDNSEPPRIQATSNNTYKQPSPKKSEPTGKLHHISTNLNNKKKKTTYASLKHHEPLNTRGSNGNYTSKDELDIPSVDTNYINDDFDNYNHVPIREDISPNNRGKKLERTVTAESEKQELIQRLSNSPFIKKYELEPPDDPSLRLEPSYVEMSDEEREKKIKQELQKLQHKIKDVDSLTRILMSDQFRELLKIEGASSSSKSTRREDHLKNSPSIRDKNTSRDSSPLKKTPSLKKFGQPTNLNENSPHKEPVQAVQNSKPVYKPSHRRAASNIVSYAIPNFKKAGFEQGLLDDQARFGFKAVYTPTKNNANDRRKGIPMELRS